MTSAFPVTELPAEFEIPNDWLNEAGFDGTKPAQSAALSPSACDLFDLRRIEPPYRVVAKPLDWNGFSHDRFVCVLKGMLQGSLVEPVLLCPLEDDACGRRPYDFRVIDGYHRFYAAVAVGWPALPGRLA